MARKFRSIRGNSGRGGPGPATRDVWAETETDVQHRAGVQSGDIVEHKDHTTVGQQFHDRPAPKRQHVYKPPSGRTLLPHGGSSYNPTEKERKEAVALANAELEKQEQYAKRIESKQPKFMKRRRAEKRGREEDSEEEETREAEVEDEEAEEAPKKKMPKRKTTAQRNKDQELRQQQIKQLRKKQKTELEAQVDRIASIATELKKQNEERAAKLDERKKRVRSKSDVRVRRIGGVRFRLPAVHVLAEEDDVKRNLRTQQIGEAAEMPLKERFQNLQERNWLGSRTPKTVRKVPSGIDKYRTFTKYTS